MLFFQTYHEVVDEIYYKVTHLEPWEKGSRKTSGQTGMCGGVRGVSFYKQNDTQSALLFMKCFIILNKTYGIFMLFLYSVNIIM